LQHESVRLHQILEEYERRDLQCENACLQQRLDEYEKRDHVANGQQSEGVEEIRGAKF
ncbi:unnamed protein product, partial [Dovyalis caffra]